VTIVRDLIREEGAMALFKGLTPKVCRVIAYVYLDADSDIEILVVGPKLVFSYTIAQSLIPWFARYV
jgi:Mitochondrial carrier protein